MCFFSCDIYDHHQTCGAYACSFSDDHSWVPAVFLLLYVLAVRLQNLKFLCFATFVSEVSRTLMEHWSLMPGFHWESCCRAYSLFLFWFCLLWASLIASLLYQFLEGIKKILDFHAWGFFKDRLQFDTSLWNFLFVILLSD